MHPAVHWRQAAWRQAHRGLAVLAFASTLCLGACGTVGTASKGASPLRAGVAGGPGLTPDERTKAGRGAQASTASGTATSTSAASGTTGSSTSGAPPTPPAFTQITRGAEREDGLLPIWRKQDKVWIELSPQAFGKPFFLSPKLATGIGEAGVFGGMMQSRWAQVGRPQWVEFRKVNQQVQLVAINAIFTARPGSPQARAVASAFSPSLLASVPLASAPQASSGAVLIEANALMLTDMLGMALHLQRAYRQSYALDSRNSALTRVAPQDKALVFEVSQHFATSSISSGGTSGSPPSSVPASVPDPRSLFVTAHYTLTPLPATPMPTRIADARVGYFTSTIADFTNDLARTPRLRHINRWRLEKKEPDAPLSEPVQPIVYWLDPSIPEAYRQAISAGALEWNKAFEAIGLRNAIEVRTAPADEPFDAQQTGHVSIRWMTNSQPAFGAIGPTHVDPRTGEILDASIALESLSSRAMRTVRSQFIAQSGNSPASLAWPGWPSSRPDPAASLEDPAPGLTHDGLSPEACAHGDHAAEQLGLAMEVMAAGGLLDPDSPQVQEFVLAYLKDVAMHEVGHTLGLRHNFRASMWRTEEELNDPVIGAARGNSASVMDYTPVNLPRPGQRGGAPFQTTLGPYDYWAIEYGYKPLPGDPAQAQAALRAIAQRSDDPAWVDALAFGTDEDQGVDPQAIAFDLGKDPVAHARTRLAIVRDLFERQRTRPADPDDDPSLARRSIGYGLREIARTGQILLRQVGGLVTRRNGTASGRDLLDPLPAKQQRAALQMLLGDFLAPDALALPPALQRRLATDFLDRQDYSINGQTSMSTDFSWAGQQLALQRMVLGSLMNENLAERMLDNIDKTRDTERQPLTPQAMYQGLRQTIWSGKALPPSHAGARRNLQREHVNRLAAAIVGNGSDRADVRALVREEAMQVLRLLRGRGPAPGASPGPSHKLSRTQARDEAHIETLHRRDCIDTLNAALSASVLRAAP